MRTYTCWCIHRPGGGVQRLTEQNWTFDGAWLEILRELRLTLPESTIAAVKLPFEGKLDTFLAYWWEGDYTTDRRPQGTHWD